MISLALLGLIAGGCSSGKPSRKEQARANWNAARAGVLLNLANDQYRHGNFADARKTSNEALKLSNKVPGLFVLRAKLDIEDGELQSAAAALAAAKALSPADPEPYYLSGIVNERWQKAEDALADYRAALERNGSEMAYLLAVAESLVGLDRPAEAAALLEPKVAYFESSAPIRDMLGQVYAEQGRHAEAAEMFRQAAVLAPDDADIRERQAVALAQAGDFRRAADLLERLTAEPANAEKVSLHLTLAECRMQMGNAAGARAAYQRATRIDERNVAAWLGVGKAALAAGELDRAEVAVGRAEALRPAGRVGADVALLRGYVQLKRGQVEQAAASFAAAGRIEPRDPMPLTMYGYCQQLLGRPAEARRFYDRALELDPGETLADELKRALAAAPTDPLP